MKVYLDYAAATPISNEVLAAMQPYFIEKFYNPSALYLDAKAVHHDIETARADVASVLGARPSEIVFTAGGSEANNLAIQGVIQMFPEANIVVSAVEHESVLKPAERYISRLAPVLPDGRIDLGALDSLIDDETVLVSVMYANNEVGTIQPIRELSYYLSTRLEQRRKHGNDLPLYLHSDACQAANYLDLHVDKKGIDLLTLNGGKIYGPKQSGALYVRTGVELQPQILGGGQEWGLRNGTENVAGIIGFAKALSMAQAQRNEESKRLEILQTEAFRLIDTYLPTAIINGSTKYRLVNNIHLTIPGHDNERLIMALDERGIQCAAGSACSASNEEPSHVLRALGLDDQAAQASLRLTMGRMSDEQGLRAVIESLAELI